MIVLFRDRIKIKMRKKLKKFLVKIKIDPDLGNNLVFYLKMKIQEIHRIIINNIDNKKDSDIINN